jgi:hypothetical protein
VLPGRGSVVVVERGKQAEVGPRAVFLGHKDPYPSFGAPALVLKVGLIHDFVVREMDRDLLLSLLPRPHFHLEWTRYVLSTVLPSLHRNLFSSRPLGRRSWQCFLLSFFALLVVRLHQS